MQTLVVIGSTSRVHRLSARTIHHRPAQFFTWEAGEEWLLPWMEESHSIEFSVKACRQHPLPNVFDSWVIEPETF